MTSRYVLYETYSELCLLSQIQTYSGIFTSYLDIHVMAYLEPCVTLAYPEPCHIQNPEIFRTRDIFRARLRHALVYSERWEPCHVQNFAIFRILTHLWPEAYSESCSFSHIRAYFSTKLKNTYVFWLQWRQFQCSTESTQIIHDLWKWRYNRINKTE